MTPLSRYSDASDQEVNEVMQKAYEAFLFYSKTSLTIRVSLMNEIANRLDAHSNELIIIAQKETRLSKARLKTELRRTSFQLRSYGAFCESGQWLDARIDIPTEEHYVKKDIRKTMIPLGPVVIFGSSNFPFAYSTAGGDTACALAAGCPVIVKAHPGHPNTSEKIAGLIHESLKKMNLPKEIFSHLHGASFHVGELLVKHPLTKAVGFTGSYSGGKQLFDWANQRKTPIPVFAEMGSSNPVFIFPERLDKEYEAIAKELGDSITLSMGQFCTKPGLIISLKSKGLNNFSQILSEYIRKCEAEPMLNSGIYNNFNQNKSLALSQSGVTLLSASTETKEKESGIPTLTHVTATEFISNSNLHKEVFGPFSLIIECDNANEMKMVADSIDGQLTATIIASAEEIRNNHLIIDSLKNIGGRIIFNGVPTGVEVCLSMHHGGPFPATTDSRFTSVGADGIKRFTRPICYQNCEDEFLPDELKNSNPLNIIRTVNNKIEKGIVKIS